MAGYRNGLLMMVFSFLLVLLIIKVYEGRDKVPFVSPGPGIAPGTRLTLTISLAMWGSHFFVVMAVIQKCLSLV